MNAHDTSYDPTIEEALRRELSSYDLPPLDLDGLLDDGHRALRRRTQARLAGATAALVALAVGGYALSGNVTRNAQPAPPATTSHVSPTPQATSPVTARLEEFSALGALDGKQVDPGVYGRLAVTWDPAAPADGSDLTYSTVADDGSLTQLGGSSTRGLNAMSIIWGTSGPESHVIVGVMPKSAARFDVVLPEDPAGGHARTSAVAPIDGSPWQAFGVFFEDGQDVKRIVDILWQDTDGVVRDQEGGQVPSVALRDRDATTIYLAEQADVFGAFSARGGSTSTWTSDRPADSPRPVLGVTSIDDTQGEGLFAILIPAGATTPAVAPGSTTTGFDEPRIAEIPGTGKSVLWARYTTTTSPKGQTFASVSWTEADGNRVTITSY